MEVERPVEETAAGAARAVPFQGGPRRGQHFGVMGEAEVVVRPHHDPLLAFDDDDGVFGAGDRLEVGVQPRSLDLARPGEVLTLVEQRDVLQGLCAHEASVPMGRRWYSLALRSRIGKAQCETWHSLSGSRTGTLDCASRRGLGRSSRRSIVVSHVVRFLGVALFLCPIASVELSAQSGFHPHWEIPGFDFRENGGWRVRARQISQIRRQLLSAGKVAPLNQQAIGPQPTAAVSGTVIVPAIFFAYSNTDSAQFMTDTAQYNTALFSPTPPGGNPYTLRTFYQELSNNQLSMTGKILGWVRLDSAETTYTGVPGTCSGNPFGTTNCNGLFSSAAISRMQAGFRQALARVDAQVDFGQFDNDGPDGIPNSGDDDGYVDMIMFAHPTKDGACGGQPVSTDASTNNHIWSHRYVLLNSYVTNDPAHAGNKSGFAFIHVRDYFATSALGGASACDTTQIMPIGTAAHEFGHALGLPDLYDTQETTEGEGEWGLMGSGNFTSPRSPSRMEAWSLNELGWVSLRILNTAGTYHLGAAPVSDTAFYVNVQGNNPRSEYFLLENRQAAQADTALIRIHCVRSGQPPNCPGGMLIWHADSLQLATNGFHASNAVNVGGIHGLAVEEADGLGQLYCGVNGCNRGDAGDYYPGTSGNTKLSFNTNPAASKNWDGSFIGFAIDSIRQIVPGGEMAFRLRFGGLTVVRASDTFAVISVDAVNYN